MFGLNEDGKRTFAITVVCVILSGIAIVLRILCKRLQGRFRQDDFWIIVALLFGYAAEASLTWGSITGGGGKEMKEILTSGDKDTFQEMANYLEVWPKLSSSSLLNEHEADNACRDYY
jgi:hypothetical protein